MTDQPRFPRDDALRPFATARQWELLEAYWTHGSSAKAVAALGLRNRSSIDNARAAVVRAAARRGYAPSYHHTHQVPDGYKLRGVSSLYRRGEEEPVLQWVKTSEDRDRQLQLLREMTAGFTESIVPVDPTPEPDAGTHELCAVYPVVDHHLGMYAWREEAGTDYDLGIARSLLLRAVDALVRAMPNAQNALVPLLGDLFHYDTLEPVTPTHRNLLDSDGRYAKMVRTTVHVVRGTIDRCLEKHGVVHVVVQPGNHDPSSSVFLTECLSALYESEPRVNIDRSPRQFHYHRHGRCLVGICHGHEVKRLDQLPLIMATDRPRDWGETGHRYWLTGHVHSDRVVDVQGCRVESFRTLAPTDAWASGHGYRSAREMKALLLHAQHGETQRVSVNPGMFDSSTGRTAP